MNASVKSGAVPIGNRRAFVWPAWGWSLLGVVVLLGCLMLVRPGSSPLSPLLQVLSLAPYLVLVALGQMIVITLGAGNIDVSVGAVISMASYVSIGVGQTTSPGVGLLAGVGVGIAAGIISATAILLLRVPPIIATLATSLIVASTTLVLNDVNTASADASLQTFVGSKLLGVPTMALIVAALTVVVWFVVTRTRFGLAVIALGQSTRAAERAGLPVKTVTATAYLLCGGLAGATGGLLAAFISPSTSLGQSYMLDSIAVVVVGGTLISGGRPTTLGIWTGALFFVLLSSLLNVIGWSVGAQNVLKGALLVAVVLVAAKATGTGRSLISRWRTSLHLDKNTKETQHA